MTQNISPAVIKAKDAAIYIGMSDNFLRKSRMDGKRTNRTPGPPYIKMGRAVRYLIDDLNQWLHDNRYDN